MTLLPQRAGARWSLQPHTWSIPAPGVGFAVIAVQDIT